MTGGPGSVIITSRLLHRSFSRSYLGQKPLQQVRSNFRAVFFALITLSTTGSKKATEVILVIRTVFESQ